MFSPAVTDATVTAFLVGFIAGTVVMIALLSIRPLAIAVLAGFALGILFLLFVDGPGGLVRWLRLGVSQLAQHGAWFAGFGLGKVLAGIIVTALGGMQRRRQ